MSSLNTELADAVSEALRRVTWDELIEVESQKSELALLIDTSEPPTLHLTMLELCEETTHESVSACLEIISQQGTLIAIGEASFDRDGNVDVVWEVHRNDLPSA